MSAFARAHVLAILRQHGLSTADAGAIVDEDDRAALGAFLSGRTDDLDIDPLEDLAHAVGLTIGQQIGERATGAYADGPQCRTHLGGIYPFPPWRLRVPTTRAFNAKFE
ncbi:MAG TPA: hypothetical protein VE087_00620 [Xanthobacteraceae bacterium]|nr:hypothetical protein [Xanthobacteraceae bacterium]